VRPLAARAQLVARQPVRIGFLRASPPPESIMAALRRGLAEQGYEEAKGMRWAAARSTISLRCAREKNGVPRSTAACASPAARRIPASIASGPGPSNSMYPSVGGGDYERLPALAADLVKRNVAVIVAHGPPAAKAAKAATSGDDPIRTGLVSSINRPGGNVTGVTLVVSQVLTKRVEILHELLPKAGVMAVLVNPNSTLHDVDRQEAAVAARTIGVAMHVLDAAADSDLDRTFAAMAERRVGALAVGADPFFNTRREKIVGLAAQHRIPTMFPFREFPVAGGLMSYGTNLAFGYHASALYAARILKGDKPADLPVQQPTKFKLVINMKTAQALGLDVPPMLLARADEVIE
jgi:putative ABC transport system substrate-binding protein